MRMTRMSWRSSALGKMANAADLAEMLGYKRNNGYKALQVIRNNAEQYREETGKTVAIAKRGRQWVLEQETAMSFVAWFRSNRKNGAARKRPKAKTVKRAKQTIRRAQASVEVARKGHEEMLAECFRAVQDECGAEALALIGIVDPLDDWRECAREARTEIAKRGQKQD